MAFMQRMVRLPSRTTNSARQIPEGRFPAAFRTSISLSAANSGAPGVLAWSRGAKLMRPMRRPCMSDSLAAISGVPILRALIAPAGSRRTFGALKRWPESGSRPAGFELGNAHETALSGGNACCTNACHFRRY